MHPLMMTPVFLAILTAACAYAVSVYVTDQGLPHRTESHTVPLRHTSRINAWYTPQQRRALRWSSGVGLSSIAVVVTALALAIH